MSADPLLDPPPSAVPGTSLSGPGVTAPSLSGAGGRFLSDIVVELGFVEPAVADDAVQAGRRPGYTPERVMLESGALTEDQLSRALAERYGLDHLDLSAFAVDASAAGLLREHAARRYQAVPVGFTHDGTLIVAVSDPGDSLGLTDIAVMTKLAVRPAVASRSQIDALLDTLHFMEEPVAPGPQTIGTLIVPPEEDAGEEGTQALRIAPLPPAAVPAPDAGRVEELERELAELRRAHEEALRETRTEADRQVAKAEAEHEGVLADLKGAHELALADERARRTVQLESERAQTGSEIEAERERHQKELDALRARSEQALEEERAAAARELERERERHEQALAEQEVRSAEALALEAEREASDLESVAAKHAAAIEAQRTAHAVDAAELRDRLAGERARGEELAALLGEASDDSEQVTALEQQLAAAHDVEKRLEQALESERSAHAQTVDELREKLANEQGRTEELTSRLEEASGQGERLAALEQQLERSEQAQRAAAEALDDAAAASAAQLDEALAAADTYREELERERAAHANDTGELHDRLAGERARAEELAARLEEASEKSAHVAALGQQLERAEASLREAREARESAVREAEGAQRAAAEALDDAAAASAAALDQALAEAADAHREELERQRAEHTDDVAELRDRLARQSARVEELEARLQEVLDEATAASAAELDQALAAAADAHRDELERERAGHAESVDELRRQLASQSARVEELEQAEAGLRETQAAAARHAEHAQRAAAEALEEAKAASAAERDQAIAEIERLRGELELLADADRRAEDARAALTELREESERQAELHSLIERDLGAELRAGRERNEALQSRLQDMQEKIAEATTAFEAVGLAADRLNEIATSVSPADAEA